VTRMNIFEEAMKLGAERYDREKLLSITSDLIARFRLPNRQDKTKMRASCRHLADALDRCSGSTLQQRWYHFEKKIWTKWSVGVGRPSQLWTWGARVVVPTRMVFRRSSGCMMYESTGGSCAYQRSIRWCSSTACSWGLLRESLGRELGTDMKQSVTVFAFSSRAVTTACARLTKKI
jgi:hypothetical protein